MKHRVDEQGFIIDSFSNDYPHFQEDWLLIETKITESFIKPKWNGTRWIEGATPEEIIQEKREKAIQIDLEYTERISGLMMKHNDKFIQGILNNNPYIIPQDVLDERERLRNECNQIILELGIEDFTYRQSNLQLKTL